MHLLPASVAAVAALAWVSVAGAVGPAQRVETAAYFPELTTRITGELKVSLEALSASEQAPATLFGEPLGGAFTWSIFAGALARVSELTGSDALAGQPLLPWMRRGLESEMAGQGTTFSQLYTGELLLRSCREPGKLETSALWRALSKERQAECRAFLDVRRFYTEATGDLGGRPNNYFGVALLLEAYRTKLGLTDDPGRLDRLFAGCAGLLERTGGWLDDSRTFQGGFDRYHHEFVRFMWEAAELTGRDSVLRTLKPFAVQSGRLWWDLLHPEQFHAASWGRSLQNVWDDTAEQAAFFAARPELAPVATEQLAAAFTAAVGYYFRHEYNAGRHLNRMLEPGRGTWSYSGRDRIWSTTVGSLGKLSAAAAELRVALERQQVTGWPARPTLETVNRLQRFQTAPQRPSGVWIHRQPTLAFVLPVVGSGVVADYLPIPRGLPLIQTPVQQTAAVLVPFVTLENGATLVPGQMADRLGFDEDGRGLSIAWNTLPDLKGKPTATPLAATSRWQVDGGTLVNRVVFTAREPVALSGMTLAIPVNGEQVAAAPLTFAGDGRRLALRFEAPEGTTIKVEPPASEPLSRGAFAPIRHYVQVRVPAVKLRPGERLELGYQLIYTE